jgi:cysteine desulfurase/selenocysteine lyase
MSRTNTREDSPTLLPESIRKDFPILSRTVSDGMPLAYLDNAATTQKPWPVLDALTEYYSTSNSNVGRGYYQLSMESTTRLEQARLVVQAAIGAASPHEVVFTSGTTDAVNLLADTLGRQRVRRGDRVVVTGMEHNSNLLPWRRLCELAGAKLVVVPVNAAGRVEVADFEAAMGHDVRLAAVSHVSNVLGTVNPVRELAAAAHRHAIPLVVDGAQAVPHWPVDVTDLGADFYCFSGHKVYGPMGTGVLYGRQELLSTLPPYRVGGGTVKGVTMDAPVDYVPAPERLEAGTPNVAGAVGLAAALTYLQGLGWDTVRRHDEHLVRSLVDAVGELDRVRVIGDPGSQPSGIVSLAVDGIHPYDVGGHLDRLGIAVRCGVHCASTFLDDLGLVGTVRVSFGVYNTDAEIERLRQALATVRPGDWTRDHPKTRFL